MRLIFTCIISLCMLHAAAQQPVTCKVGGLEITPQKKDTTKNIRIYCVATASKEQEPLYVIDGIVTTGDQIKSIDPNDIDNITVMKGSKATAIYGKAAAYGVIVITLKENRFKGWILKDSADGNLIPAANCTFYALDKPVLRLIADDSGRVERKEISSRANEIKISAVGYKSKRVVLTKDMESQNKIIFLEKDIIECAPVIIRQSGLVIRCYRQASRHYFPGNHTCGVGECSIIISQKDTIIANPRDNRHGRSASFTSYPNPVQRGGTINLALNNLTDAAMQLQITDLNGRLVLTHQYKTGKGTTSVQLCTDSRWTAGMYLIQLRNDKGALLHQQKMMMQ